MNEKADKEQKTVIRVYGAFVAALAMSCVPSLSFAVVSLLLFAGILAAAYVIRRKAAEDSLTKNHMIFIIRTLWITALFMLVTVTAASFYLWRELDPAALGPCSQSLMDRIMQADEAGNTISVFELSAYLDPCMGSFVRDNLVTFLIATLVAAGPVLVYLIMRLYKGLSRALKGYRLADPKRWF